MADDPSSKSGAQWEQRLHEAGARVEEDLRSLITYFNDEVVPDVRKHGSVALRKAAEQMEKLAQKMDDRRRSPGAAGSSSAGSGADEGEEKQ